MKLILCCQNASNVKPYLKKYWFNGDNGAGYNYETSFCENEGYDSEQNLNGMVLAECDCIVGDIHVGCREKAPSICYLSNRFWTMDYEEDILKRSGYTDKELDKYLSSNPKNKCHGYMLKLENLNIFDKPKNINEYYSIEDIGGMLFTHELKKAPKRMCYVSINQWDYMMYNPDDLRVFISLSPEKMADALNGELDILIFKKVLKSLQAEA